MNLDIERLSPTEQLRHHVRRGQHREAIALALELLDDDTARRSAWRAIQSGAIWSCVDEEGEAAPLITQQESVFADVMKLPYYLEPGDLDRAPFNTGLRSSWVTRPLDAKRWLSVEGSRVPALWGELRAQHFASDCRKSIEHLGAEVFSEVLLSTFWGGGTLSGRIARGCCDAMSATTGSLDREAWELHARDVIAPLMLRWMLLPIDELTSASSINVDSTT